MSIGLQTSKLEGSMERERSFSAVNLPCESIKTETGSVKNISAGKRMENAAPLRKHYKALQTQIKLQAWKCFEVQDGTLRTLKSWVGSGFLTSSLQDVD